MVRQCPVPTERRMKKTALHVMIEQRKSKQSPLSAYAFAKGANTEGT
jgi:hypothetical protein